MAQEGQCGSCGRCGHAGPGADVGTPVLSRCGHVSPGADAGGSRRMMWAGRRGRCGSLCAGLVARLLGFVAFVLSLAWIDPPVIDAVRH